MHSPPVWTGGWRNTPFPITNCIKVFIFFCGCAFLISKKASESEFQAPFSLFDPPPNIPSAGQISFSFHWKFKSPSRNVFVKTLTSRGSRHQVWMWKRSTTFHFVSSSASYYATFLIKQRLSEDYRWHAPNMCSARPAQMTQSLLLMDHWWELQKPSDVLCHSEQCFKMRKAVLVASSVHQDLQVWLARCQLQVWGLLRRLSATSKVRL